MGIIGIALIRHSGGRHLGTLAWRQRTTGIFGMINHVNNVSGRLIVILSIYLLTAILLDHFVTKAG